MIHLAKMGVLCVLLGGCTGAKHAQRRIDAAVRYPVTDLERSLDFYIRRLGFQQVDRYGSILATVRRGSLHLLLSVGEGLPPSAASAARGWTRLVVYVEDLEAATLRLRGAGLVTRREIVDGLGGRSLLLEDPDGNPVELHQPPAIANEKAMSKIEPAVRPGDEPGRRWWSPAGTRERRSDNDDENP